jgi:hypothetical protein
MRTTGPGRESAWGPAPGKASRATDRTSGAKRAHIDTLSR